MARKFENKISNNQQSCYIFKLLWLRST